MSITTQQAKQISLVEYLSKRGYKHVFTRKGEYWYLSPMREETKPSFAVKEGAGSNGEDLWDDFGYGGGGSIIDLVMAMEQLYSVPQALQHLESYYTTGSVIAQRQKQPQKNSLFQQKKESSIKNVVVRPLNHFVLLKYLLERGISEARAKKHLKLIWYENNGRKNLFSFGWRNQSGAWELRSNQSGGNSFKAVTGKKDITFLSHGKGENLYIFEGMLDYLSALELKKTDHLNGDIVILNSTTLVSRAIILTQQRNYKTIYTFFDNDPSGKKAFDKFQIDTKHEDIRPQVFYNKYKDVNDYLMSRLH